MKFYPSGRWIRRHQRRVNDRVDGKPSVPSRRGYKVQQHRNRRHVLLTLGKNVPTARKMAKRRINEASSLLAPCAHRKMTWWFQLSPNGRFNVITELIVCCHWNSKCTLTLVAKKTAAIPILPKAAYWRSAKGCLFSPIFCAATPKLNSQ